MLLSCADCQNTPQVPRIHVSTFSRRPTAHAQTMKRSPRPLASLEVNKKKLYWGQNHLFGFNRLSTVAWLQAGRVWGPSDVTPLIFNTHSKCRVIASWRKKSWAMDEAMECNGWTLTLTMVWLNGKGVWNESEGGLLDTRSKLNEIKSIVTTNEAVVYYPLIDWKTKKMT